ncbi:4Fe-4S binding protein [candidate division CSSED10-310 bacterium]|uniref:4Fe-4S binding protein n=1 Tax=candidate division CSSED10-310 bacterium TaxID=2855610 RepID=A0ABV6Z2V2_UNCC1
MAKQVQKSKQTVRRLRIITQVFFLFLFLYLFVKTDYSGEPNINTAVRFFLEIDPLVALVTILEYKGFPPDLSRLFLLSGALLITTVILGRFFCGWICPLGTINHVVGFRKKISQASIKKSIYSGQQRLKYLFLFLLLILSVFSLQLAGIFDPISLLIRSLAFTVLPAFHFTAEVISIFFLNHELPVLTSISEFLYQILRDNVLPFKVQYFTQNIFIGLLFAMVILLNRLRPRFWCRFICPLGALLAVSSSYSRVQRQVSQACTECNICHSFCQGAPAKNGAKEWNPQECFLCFNCQSVCPEDAVSFHFRKQKMEQVSSILPARRALLQSAGAALLAVPLFYTQPSRLRAHPNLIRPPGSRPESEFLNRCVRCGECMKVCPTNGLQPTFLEAGPEGIWSPHFIMTIGYCEYSCTLCGQVCPTDAIRTLVEKEKTGLKIGLAFIDVARCLPFAFNTPCIVCEEHCPTPKKAIIFEEREITTFKGERKIIKFPKVDPHLCIGCGICENKCPVVDKPAIYITSIGESRAEDNQLILSDESAGAGY